MEGMGLMSFRVIWFVVAGFVLGFTTSTLWEWLYYRQKRLQMLDQHRQTQRDAGGDSAVSTRSNLSAGATDNSDAEWQLPTYRSSGILLESEGAVLPTATTSANPQRQSTDMATPPPTESPRESPPKSQEAANEKQEQPSASAAEAQGDERSSGDAHGRKERGEERESQERNRQAGNRQVTARAVTETDTDTVTDTHSTAPTGADHVAVTKATFALSPVAEKLGSASTAPDSSPTESAAAQGTVTVDHPDNLADIKGIGEAYKRRLYATGVYTWRQLAESDTDTLRRITRAKPNADIRSWQAQAQELAEEHNRWQANFNGPLDDFTRIEGIGAITADILYKVGICTYEELAATAVEELTRIVPAPTVGNENDFDGWLREASHLARAKERNGGRLP